MSGKDRHTSDSFERKGYCLDLLEKLYQTRRLTADVHLIPANATNDNDCLPANKLILATGCPYFQDLFYPQIKTEPEDADADALMIPIAQQIPTAQTPSKVNIPINKIILELILKYIYLNQYAITLARLEGLMGASKLFNLDKLTQKCENFLHDQEVTKETWAIHFRLANENIKNDDMLERVYQFLKSISPEILDTQGFVDLKFRELKMLVDAGVWANPTDLQMAKFKWFGHENHLKIHHMQNLVKLDLPKVDSASNPQDKSNENLPMDLPVDNQQTNPANDQSLNQSPLPSSTSLIKSLRISNTKPVLYDFEEIIEHLRPSLWLGDVVPKKSPYFPQMGDELVYFRQGHERYVDFVSSFNVYPINNKDASLPYIANPNLEAEVAVKIISIKYEMLHTRVVCLKLTVNDWITGDPLGTQITLKYHDIPGVVDFLILRQMFDKSLEHNWHEGDRFRSLLEDDWWLGTIKSQEPADKRFPYSRFLCYKTIWDKGDEDKMSPWDLEVIPDDFEIPEGKVDGIPASEDELRACLYEANPSDWPQDGRQDAECSRISSLLGIVMDLPVSEAFRSPVDLNRFPEYAYKIPYPMNLSTIKKRLDNLFYRRQAAILHDLKYIAINAERFNESGSDIVMYAKVIRDLCTQIVEYPVLRNVNRAYESIMNFYKEIGVAQEPGEPGEIMISPSEVAKLNGNGKKSDPTEVPSYEVGRIALKRKMYTSKLNSESLGSSKGQQSSAGSQSTKSPSNLPPKIIEPMQIGVVIRPKINTLTLHNPQLLQTSQKALSQTLSNKKAKSGSDEKVLQNQMILAGIMTVVGPVGARDPLKNN